MLGSVHPIVYGCYGSLFEFGGLTMSYIKTFLDWKNMIVSMIHTTGDIYDTVSYAVSTIETYPLLTTDDQKVEFWYKIGIYFGVTLRLMLDHPPAAFYVEDPADKFPRWDTF
jgi:hypothetical protein